MFDNDWPAAPYVAPKLLPAVASGAPTLDTVHCCDVLTFLRALPDCSVNCVVTSPPYFGLRDYGVVGQIGLEPTPQQFVATMVAVFREVRRILRGDGVLWLNLGDSYAGGGNYRGHSELSDKQHSNRGSQGQLAAGYVGGGFKSKGLMMIPARVAIALQDDGWYLRSEIIWHKPSVMPESVTDRPTKAHEMVYLLTKRPDYWYDADAIREPQITLKTAIYYGTRGVHGYNAASGNHRDKSGSYGDGIGRNKRTVWTVNPEPTPFAHFATFPRKLIEPMILAGCPVGGLVLDPFLGSGTTALVARALGRHYIGCDLNPEYVALARRRLSTVEAQPFLMPFVAAPQPSQASQASLFAEALT